MSSPEIQAYLEAKAEYLRASDESLRHSKGGTENVSWRLLDAAKDKSEELLAACLPSRLRTGVGKFFLSAYMANELENEFVYFPVLVDELGGNREAAEVAWALGQRPAGYPIAGGA